jgi:Flp pilus assembly protein TadB
MQDTFPLKLIEVFGVLIAGIAFAVWQLRDLKREKERSARQKAQNESTESEKPDQDRST